MYALFKESSHQNFLSHKSQYGTNPVANPDNWVAFDGQHVHYSTNNLEALTDDLIWYFRKTAGAKNSQLVNDRATITAIKGNSVAWNQLMPAYDDCNKQYGTYTKQSWGVWKVVPSGNTSNSTATTYGTQYETKPQGGHKYYISAEMRNGTGGQVQVLICDWALGTYMFNVGTDQFVRTSVILYCNSNSSYMVSFAQRLNANEYYIKNVMIIDLTNIYGSGNEPATPEQFEADYFKWFGKPLTYEPYDSGSIRNTKIDSLKTVGFNQWDGEYEEGYHNLWDIGAGAAPNNVDNGETYYRSKNFIPCLPDTDYYFKGNSFRTLQYDALKVYLESNIGFKTGSNFIAHTHSRARYFKFYLPITDMSKIIVNVSSTSNGTIEAYEDRIYSIPITSITGKLNGTGNSVVVFPDGMKSAGPIYDEIINEGGVTKAIRRIAKIVCDTNTFYEISYIGSGAASIMLSSPNYGKRNGSILSSNEYISTISENIGSQTNKSIRIPPTGTYDRCICIKDTANISSSDNQTTIRNKLNGLIIYYELETPKVYVLDNFTLPINVKVWKSGMEIYESSDSTGTSPKLTIHYNAQ